MARAEMIDLFRHQADEGLHVLISSHILHEVDDLADRVVLINGGYIVAEGDIEGVRDEVEEQPLQVLVRCDRPSLVARRLSAVAHVTEVSLHADGAGLLVRSTNADQLYLALNRVIVEEGLAIEAVAPADAEALAWQAIERVGLVEAARRKVAGYSKGMRQRIRLAQAIAHRPAVLILDEPLNGLDPMARAEMIDLFRHQADEGLHVLISSHILHEVDDLADRVVLINGGYIVAEGDIEGVRDEVEEQPLQALVRCDRPALVARRLFDEAHVTEVSLHADGGGLFVRSTNADLLYLALNRVIVEEGLAIETVAPADADMGAVYQYLIGGDEVAR
jgi:ABC-type multidrug transport system ATPase subunit